MRGRLRKKTATAAAPETERLERLLREERGRGEAREKELLLALVSLADGFSRLEKALAGEGIGEEARRVVERFALVRKRLEKQLEKEGLERVDAAGPFDADRHEAIELRAASGAPHGTILEIEQDGWLVRGRLLRPAKVVVAE